MLPSSPGSFLFKKNFRYAFMASGSIFISLFCIMLFFCFLVLGFQWQYWFFILSAIEQQVFIVMFFSFFLCFDYSQMSIFWYHNSNRFSESLVLTPCTFHVPSLIVFFAINLSSPDASSSSLSISRFDVGNTAGLTWQSSLISAWDWQHDQWATRSTHRSCKHLLSINVPTLFICRANYVYIDPTLLN